MSSALDVKAPAPAVGLALLQQNRGGFNFDLVRRNEFLVKVGKGQPKVKKTGTTIAGVVYKDGVVLGADTRATEGPIVCDKNCEKIHKISKLIWCCGAGTSADTENVTGLISSQLELLRLTTGTEPRVITAMTRLKQHLFKYQGHVSAALVLGGWDVTGPSLYTVYPHGSTDKLPYATMGSGSLAAMAVFESKYKDDMDEKSAVALVSSAIQAGIFNDLGSGGNVDICVLNKQGQTMLRTYQSPTMDRYKKPVPPTFAKGTTEIIAETQQLYKTLLIEDRKEQKEEKGLNKMDVGS